MFLTQRLVIRAFEETDLDDFSGIVGDPDVMAFVGNNRPLTRERAEIWARESRRRHDKREPSTYAICVEHGAFVGYGGFTRTPSGDFEIIYGFGKAHWGKGYGYEVAKALTAYAFASFRLPRLWATIDPENSASLRIVEKLEMDHVEDRLDEHGLPERVFVLRASKVSWWQDAFYKPHSP